MSTATTTTSDRVREEHLEQALAYLRAQGYFKSFAGKTYAEIGACPIEGRLLNMHALLIAKGTHPSLTPTHHRPEVIAPEAPFPMPNRPHRPARPYQPPKHQAVLFDARAAAAGDTLTGDDEQ